MKCKRHEATFLVFIFAACGLPEAELVGSSASCPFLRVYPAWTEVHCVDSPDRGIGLAVNAVEISSLSHPWRVHHEAFFELMPWYGSYGKDDGILVDFLGFQIPYDLYCTRAYRIQETSQAIRTRQCDMYDVLKETSAAERRKVALSWPVVAEEYFEYVDVIRAVSSYVGEVSREQHCANCPFRPFVFVEVGAGYGHWTFAAHCILSQLAAKYALDAPLRHHYLLVDTVNTEDIVQNLSRLNSVQTLGPNGFLHFHTGFVTGDGSFGRKTNAAAEIMIKSYSDVWGVANKEAALSQIEAASLRELFTSYRLPCVIDMVDIDIQGGEYPLLAANGSVSLLTEHVKRVHIGLHAYHPWLDDMIVRRFERHGWHKEWFWHRSLGSVEVISENLGVHQGDMFQQTEWGPVTFGDGVLSLTNPARPLGQGCTDHF